MQFHNIFYLCLYWMQMMVEWIQGSPPLIITTGTWRRKDTFSCNNSSGSKQIPPLPRFNYTAFVLWPVTSGRVAGGEYRSLLEGRVQAPHEAGNGRGRVQAVPGGGRGIGRVQAVLGGEILFEGTAPGRSDMERHGPREEVVWRNTT